MSTELRGTPPNLDVYLGNDSYDVYVEAKFLEPLTLKSTGFSESYRKINDIRTSSRRYTHRV
jgi:CubicO group peptidase (beta-lactamase class C family)